MWKGVLGGYRGNGHSRGGSAHLQEDCSIGTQLCSGTGPRVGLMLWCLKILHALLARGAALPLYTGPWELCGEPWAAETIHKDRNIHHPTVGKKYWNSQGDTYQKTITADYKNGPILTLFSHAYNTTKVWLHQFSSSIPWISMSLIVNGLDHAYIVPTCLS